jgi:SET domain-containing protein
LRRLLLFAICDIAIGQELTIDYNWPAVFAIPCACGSPACRGWIVTPKDLPRVLADIA